MKIGTDFSGIGSPEMALKYLEIDFKSVFACEIDKYARQSFEQLHNTQTFYNDITTRNHKEVEQLDLYVAGFPCQSFSIAGKRKGFEELRGTLFFNVAEFIKDNQPKAFILENVKGLLNHDKGRTFQTIVDILSNGGGTQNGQISLDMFEDGLGYHIYWQVLNTKNYGIPQNRERIFIVGFKDFRNFNFPKKMPLDLKLKDMLQDNPNSKYYLSDKVVADVLRLESSIQYNAQPVKLGSSESFGGSIIIGKSNNSYCLLSSKIGAGVKINNRIRKLTPLEYWRLQGFKDKDFFSVKDVSESQLYKQAGNSITVNVLMEMFKKIYGYNKQT